MANNVTRWNGEDPPNLLLSVDPGASWPKSRVPYAACALFRWGFLERAALVKVPGTVPPFARWNALARCVCDALLIARRGVGVPGVHASRAPARWEETDVGEHLDVLAVEQPMIYVRGKARPQDVVSLSKAFGALVGGIDAGFYSAPTGEEWRGSADDKAIIHERGLAVANARERAVLIQAQREGAGGLSGHVLDSFVLGLFVIGRVGKAGEV